METTDAVARAIDDQTAVLVRLHDRLTELIGILAGLDRRLQQAAAPAVAQSDGKPRPPWLGRLEAWAATTEAKAMAKARRLTTDVAAAAAGIDCKGKGYTSLRIGGADTLYVLNEDVPR